MVPTPMFERILLLLFGAVMLTCICIDRCDAAGEIVSVLFSTANMPGANG